jgi:hypothetical protein
MDAEPLRFVSFPFFLGGMLVPVKKFSSPNSFWIFAGFSSWAGFLSSLGLLIELWRGIIDGVDWKREFTCF